jgi:hypothetical protein
MGWECHVAWREDECNQSFREEARMKEITRKT